MRRSSGCGGGCSSRQSLPACDASSAFWSSSLSEDIHRDGPFQWGGSLAAANAWVGHDKEAKDAAAQLQKVSPGYTVQTWVGRRMGDDPTYNAQYQRIVEGLRKAGVPEGEQQTN